MAKAKEVKNKKENNNKHYFKDFKAELRKVIWPTPKQLVNNTVAVITIVLITAVIVFVLDVVFEKMNTLGINKIKEAINSSNTAVLNEEASDDNAITNETTVTSESSEATSETTDSDVQTEENVNE